ncbi:hypothetical protein RW1_022_01440 [Rhodococcus wratislaviensis NBRC 100605]|uniref:Uncharacterized protein n=1 Tax=Rhodococcus wratislaviensis NBRC 100605 TaxID=1219028 RepID=X0PRL3_RHOWR|nr:hypothetical protein RW1_022_01440 [Rhodococcus wratislaviensis NBRC 100605]
MILARTACGDRDTGLTGRPSSPTGWTGGPLGSGRAGAIRGLVGGYDRAGVGAGVAGGGLPEGGGERPQQRVPRLRRLGHRLHQGGDIQLPGIRRRPSGGVVLAGEVRDRQHGGRHPRQCDQHLEETLPIQRPVTVLEGMRGKRRHYLLDGGQSSGEGVADHRRQVPGIGAGGGQIGDGADRGGHRQPVDELPILPRQHTPMHDHGGQRQPDPPGRGQLHHIGIQIPQPKQAGSGAMREHPRRDRLIQPLPHHRIRVQRQPRHPLIQMHVLRHPCQPVQPMMQPLEHPRIDHPLELLHRHRRHRPRLPAGHHTPLLGSQRHHPRSTTIRSHATIIHTFPNIHGRTCNYRATIKGGR